MCRFSVKYSKKNFSNIIVFDDSPFPRSHQDDVNYREVFMRDHLIAGVALGYSHGRA
ncbi:hypothetical protein GMMP15_860014 [Candidatus Magnetomoraceae bacterium gMMP-15]